MPEVVPDPPRSGWALLARTVGENRRLVVLGILAGIGWTAAKVAVPSMTQRAIDEGITKALPGALWHWCLLILVLGLAQGTCTGLRRYLAFSVAYRVETDLRGRMFAHLQRLHFAFHDRTQTGQLMSRSASDLQQVNNFVVLIPIGIANGLTVVAIAVILFSINAGLAALALAALPFLNVAAKRFSTAIFPASMQLQRELAEVATVVEETVTGIRAVKGFGAEAIQAGRLGDRTGRVYDQAMRAARVRATFNPILDLLPALGLVAVVWYGGHQVLSHHLTIGQLVAFSAYVVMLIVPLRMSGQLIAQGQRALASSRRVDEILSTDPVVVDPPHPEALGRGQGEVRFEAVHFGYFGPSGPRVLAGLDLVVQAGESVALVGATGSGKTTVARLIPRFYDPNSGRITIDGIDIARLRLSELRRAVGIVFEDTFLFADTVGGNIAFAEPGADGARVREAARQAGADEFVSDLPLGYDTVIGERGFSLSGGQRQRIALARAILADPRVLILDDATSSVDPTKEREITQALRHVMAGRTTIVIAHRVATIALADRVVLLEGGRIVADGTHSRLLVTSPRYREVLAHADDGSAGSVDASVGSDDASVGSVVSVDGSVGSVGSVG
ncbi:MAG: ABC transporter ATP-binding protein, partial [Acidimicrobiales bacterium]